MKILGLTGRILLGGLCTITISGGPLRAQSAGLTTNTNQASQQDWSPDKASATDRQLPSVLQKWLNSPWGSGNWLGLRTDLLDRGVSINGRWQGTFYANVDGGLQRGTTYDEQLGFRVEINYAKLTGVDALDGVTSTAVFRYQNGPNIGNDVGVTQSFNPSHVQNDKKWSLLIAGLAYTAPELFGIAKFLTVTGGWQDPILFDFFQDEAANPVHKQHILPKQGHGKSPLGLEPL